MKTKDAGLRIRIDRELREAFVSACRAHDKPAAQVLREFMEGYVKSCNDEAAALAAVSPKRRRSGS